MPPGLLQLSADRQPLPKSQKRDGDYYLGRLERQHPTTFADFKAGKYPSINEALYAAGLKRRRTRVQEMQNAWRKASAAERREFVQWLKTAGAPGRASPSMPATSPPAPAVNSERRLLPAAKARILVIMSTRGLKGGDVMVELGFNNLNPSLGHALAQGTRLQPPMVAALEGWLAKNASV